MLRFVQLLFISAASAGFIDDGLGDFSNGVANVAVGADSGDFITFQNGLSLALSSLGPYGAVASGGVQLFGGLFGGVDPLDMKLDQINGKLDVITGKLKAMDAKLTSIVTKIDDVLDHLDDLVDDIDNRAAQRTARENIKRFLIELETFIPIYNQMLKHKHDGKPSDQLEANLKDKCSNTNPHSIVLLMARLFDQRMENSSLFKSFGGDTTSFLQFYASAGTTLLFASHWYIACDTLLHASTVPSAIDIVKTSVKRFDAYLSKGYEIMQLRHTTSRDDLVKRYQRKFENNARPDALKVLAETLRRECDQYFPWTHHSVFVIEKDTMDSEFPKRDDFCWKDKPYCQLAPREDGLGLYIGGDRYGNAWKTRFGGIDYPSTLSIAVSWTTVRTNPIRSLSTSNRRFEWLEKVQAKYFRNSFYFKMLKARRDAMSLNSLYEPEVIDQFSGSYGAYKSINNPMMDIVRIQGLIGAACPPQVPGCDLNVKSVYIRTFSQNKYLVAQSHNEASLVVLESAGISTARENLLTQTGKQVLENDQTEWVFEETLRRFRVRYTDLCLSATGYDTAPVLAKCHSGRWQQWVKWGSRWKSSYFNQCLDVDANGKMKLTICDFNGNNPQQKFILHSTNTALKGSIIMNEQQGKFKCMGITRRSDIPIPDFHASYDCDVENPDLMWEYDPLEKTIRNVALNRYLWKRHWSDVAVTPEKDFWYYDPVSRLIKHRLTRLCLTNLPWGPTLLKLETCDASKDYQRWIVEI